ncbi:MAG: histidine kinase dimerization/phosphoacceptor domain -containing protein [Sphingomicrobium sp.]
MAVIASSRAPLLMLDDAMTVVASSDSFCRAFDCPPDGINGSPLAAIGGGGWNVPEIEELVRATLRGDASDDSCEIDLIRTGRPPAHLVLNAFKLEYGEPDHPLVLLTVTDVTAALVAAKLKDDLLEEKRILLQELQHRVANSLQIIASVLMQSAHRVGSEETRTHLYDAHHRVMSIATLQKQLAVASADQVRLHQYLCDLCSSIDASMIDDRQNVALTATADDSVTTANVSVSLGLIVTELVINAIKHAFPGEARKGLITVDYRARNGGWTLTVSDNGIGFKGSAGHQPGLGTGIVAALSQQLDATVERTDRGPGTTIAIAHAAA